MSGASGQITFEAVRPELDAPTLHSWITHPKARFWGRQTASLSEIRDEYTQLQQSPHQQAWLGKVNGQPAFLVETYDPSQVELAGLSELQPGDLGMHVLVAPTDQPVTGFTAAVFAAVMRYCFTLTGSAGLPAQRIVVEPDVQNTAIHRLNAKAGFVVLRQISLPDKQAWLSVCTQDDFRRSALAGTTSTQTAALQPGAEHPSPAILDVADHLRPETLEVAQRRLTAKAIAEFSHERLLTPQALSPGWWQLETGAAIWQFAAQQHPLEHWVVDPASVSRRDLAGKPAPVDVLALVAELHQLLGIPETLAATYLEELSSTLAADCWAQIHHDPQTHPDHSAAALLTADLPQVEAAMHAGHPVFLATNGRIGYGLDDYRSFAPETGAATELVWVAVRRSLAVFALRAGLTAAQLYDAELDQEVQRGFAARLVGLGLDPEQFWYLPVHPWQWRHKLAITFAADVARRDLVPLGTSGDHYQAQQSVRTFLNVTNRSRHYVKTALSVQNMGFMRGLSPQYMEATPAINDYVHELVQADPELQSCQFSILREVAAIGYTGGIYQQLPGKSAHQKMCAALWRESPQLAPGERAVTMASLLHHDHAGASLLVAMINSSGLSADQWLRSYLDVYLRPVAYCLWAYDLAFMPHGENVILVLRDQVPVRAYMKDIGEEVAVLVGVVDGQPLAPAPELPAAVSRIIAPVPEGQHILAVLTDVMDGFFRFLAPILSRAGLLSDAEFWTVVAECLRDLQAAHPELAAKFARYDLFAAEFDHSCLNRLQLRNTLQMVDLTAQADSLIMAGKLANPLHAYVSGSEGKTK